MEEREERRIPMRNHPTFLRRKDGEGAITFRTEDWWTVFPRSEWDYVAGEANVPDNFAGALIVDNRGLGRAQFTLYTYDPDGEDIFGREGGQPWQPSDEPILELLMGEDEPCQECEQSLSAADWPDFDPMEPHTADDDDTHTAEDATEGYWCCWLASDAYDAAIQAYNERTGSTLAGRASYVYLDGGEDYCYEHMFAPYDVVVWLDRYDNHNVGRRWDQYLNGATMLRYVEQLEDCATKIQRVQHLYTWREELILRLAGAQYPQTAIAEYAQISQPRVSQLIADFDKRSADIRRELRAKLQAHGVRLCHVATCLDEAEEGTNYCPNH